MPRSRSRRARPGHRAAYEVPQHRQGQAPVALVQCDLGQRAETSAVAPGLSQQRVVVAAVPVPDDRRGFGGRTGGRCQHPEEGVGSPPRVAVPAPSRSSNRPRSTSRLGGPRNWRPLPKRPIWNGNSGTSSGGSDSRYTRGSMLSAQDTRPIRSSGEGAVHRSAPDPLRRRRRRRGWNPVASPRSQPGSGDHVVIGVGDDVVPGGVHSGIAGGRQAGDRLHHAAHSPDHRSRRRRGRCRR